ncbi:hypothetical protein DOTSEDRAFT_146169 [Dothistroma septosporum NZE10]|uniref:Uncharacterized protein n=1 Tax=Dothistroma septosporum (strain NZE10 / CBS 128990) TaxID=675120 RepID=N1PZ12_DOTSN|nr:hypothetical protein DOTSEDRAFT_146169 [Dothistroma septosporum NZE10]
MVLIKERHETALWTTDEDGYRDVAIPAFEYEPLGEDDQRFLTLQPDADQASHVRCELDVSAHFDAPPYFAAKTPRGYRLPKDLIEVDGKGVIISAPSKDFSSTIVPPCTSLRGRGSDISVLTSAISMKDPLLNAWLV